MSQAVACFALVIATLAAVTTGEQKCGENETRMCCIIYNELENAVPICFGEFILSHLQIKEWRCRTVNVTNDIGPADPSPPEDTRLCEQYGNKSLWVCCIPEVGYHKVRLGLLPGCTRADKNRTRRPRLGTARMTRTRRMKGGWLQFNTRKLAGLS
jgi:hypothetical protein